MKLLSNKKVIIFDFDGVILDSMKVRDLGFREIFKNYDKNKVERLIEYHRINGGLSRFHKIKYFYNNILEQNINQEKIDKYVDEFSKIMKEELTQQKYIIKDCIQFIHKKNKEYDMHIASGSEEKELQYICEQLGISNYFLSINGSPTNKNELVKKILIENNYNCGEVVIIGDSINDYEAAIKNNISFIGYNNRELQKISCDFIEKLSNV